MSIKIKYKDGNEEIFPDGTGWEYDDETFLVIQDKDEETIAIIAKDSVLKAE
jgi:hypothetical protein